MIISIAYSNNSYPFGCGNTRSMGISRNTEKKIVNTKNSYLLKIVGDEVEEELVHPKSMPLFIYGVSEHFYFAQIAQI